MDIKKRSTHLFFHGSPVPLRALGLGGAAGLLAVLSACGEGFEAQDTCAQCSAEDPAVQTAGASLTRGVSLVSETVTYNARGEEADIYSLVPRAQRRRVYRDRFPAVVLLPGALVSKTFYSAYAEKVARQGFVVIVPNRFNAFIPGAPPQLFPDQLVLLEALAQLEAEDQDPQSPFYAIIDTSRSAVVGHSLGGAVGLFAIDGGCSPPLCLGTFQRPSSLRAGVFYGTNTISGGVVLDLDTSAVPVALIQGSLDGIATPTEGRQSFDGSIDPTKTFITIEGANHYALTNVSSIPGATPDPITQTLSQDRSIRLVARWTGRALRAYLSEDPFATFWIFASEGSLDGTVSVETVSAD